jgi:tripartite-type tricarboxylate transporter receptor subunit TctC
VRVIVGGTTGGGFDVYTLAMTRHMGKHILGHPIFVVENITGAATRIAAKYLHSAAKPDGLTFGLFYGYLKLSLKARGETANPQQKTTENQRRSPPFLLVIVRVWGLN